MRWVFFLLSGSFGLVTGIAFGLGMSAHVGAAIGFLALAQMFAVFLLEVHAITLRSKS